MYYIFFRPVAVLTHSLLTHVRNLAPHTCYVISLNDHITGIYDTQLVQGEEIFGTASK